MRNFILNIVFFSFIVILCQHVTLSEERRCRCLSNNPSCWPNTTVWQNFNESINGRLISPKPSAAVCNSNPINVNECTTANKQWINSIWRSDQPGAMQNPNWENSSCSVFTNSTKCNQGSVPILAVNATLPQHVQSTLQLVNTYNLRLIIKNTGHDYLGRSTTFGSLLLWLHYMKNKTLIENYSSCTGENLSNVIRLDAGVQWDEVYKWLETYNLIAIGGVSPSVGAIGGFLQGGGHGPLSRLKGLAADQVLEFDVITADGRRQFVSQCQNSDLFWALRGGGGGTFAIVLSAVLRTYPTVPLIGSFYRVTAPNEIRYADFVHHFIRRLSKLSDDGWAGYFYLIGRVFAVLMFLPNGDINVANATLSQIWNNYTDFNINDYFLRSFSSFGDAYANTLAVTSSTGVNNLFGSRLIPETTVRQQPDQLANILLQLNGQNGSTIASHLVAGGQVSNMSQNTSVNIAWRKALIQTIYVQTWPDGTSNEDQEKLAKHVTTQVEILDKIAGGSQSGAYLNEADANERNWQQKFFGTIENYNRLKSIKTKVDPNGIFICKKCVGSDDWSEDLNCPILSNGNKLQIAITFLLISRILFLFTV